jgi:hypothetical protein
MFWRIEMKVKRLRYCCNGASIAGEKRHPQDVMRDLGITYQHATPQSMADQWWFWIPDNAPDELPGYMTISEHNPMKSIGWGINKKTAAVLRDYREA